MYSYLKTWTQIEEISILSHNSDNKLTSLKKYPIPYTNNLQLWLDVSNYNPDDSDNGTLWKDLSPYKNHASWNTTPDFNQQYKFFKTKNRTLYGKKSNEYNITTNYTVIFIMKLRRYDKNVAFNFKGNHSLYKLNGQLLTSDYKIQYYHPSIVWPYGYHRLHVDGNYHMIVFRKNGRSLSIRENSNVLNFSQRSNYNLQLNDDIAILLNDRSNSGNNWDAQIKQMMVYNTAISNDDLNKIQDYYINGNNNLHFTHDINTEFNDYTEIDVYIKDKVGKEVNVDNYELYPKGSTSFSSLYTKYGNSEFTLTPQFEKNNNPKPIIYINHKYSPNSTISFLVNDIISENILIKKGRWNIHPFINFKTI